MLHSKKKNGRKKKNSRNKKNSRTSRNRRLQDIEINADINTFPNHQFQSSDLSVKSENNFHLSEKFIGCFIDNEDRDLPVEIKPEGSTDYCLDQCRSRGYIFAGRQFANQCWCGNNYGSHGSVTDCNNCLSQTGNYGGWRNCVFMVGGTSTPSLQPTKHATVSRMPSQSNFPSQSPTASPTREKITESICLENDYEYSFAIFDSFGDGMCCIEGDGSYVVKVDDVAIAQGGDFEKSEKFLFKYQLCNDDSDCDDGDYSTNFSCKSEVSTCIYRPKACNEYGEMVQINATTFNFPESAIWVIEDEEGVIHHEGGPYELSKRTFASNKCLPDGFYRFTNKGSDLVGIKLGVGSEGLSINEEYINIGETREFKVGFPPALPSFAPSISTSPTPVTMANTSCDISSNIIVSPNIQVKAFDWSKEALHKIVRDECKNRIVFSQSFTTESGVPCTSCSYCEGSNTSTIFDPLVADTCVECGHAGDTCDRIKYITAFEAEWIMTFLQFLSSTKDPIYDPQRIIIEGSPSGENNQFTTLFDSDQQPNFVLSKRGATYSSLFSNNKSYKRYAVTFVRNNTSKYLYLGHYGIVQSFAKQCASDLFDELAGVKVQPHSSDA